jgi:hypothetical protein
MSSIRRSKEKTLFEEVGPDVVSTAFRKGVLYHEINAGQPCLVCGESLGIQIVLRAADCSIK